MVDKLSKFFAVVLVATLGSAVCTVTIIGVVKLVMWLVGI
jgi:hypothetical protein